MDLVAWTDLVIGPHWYNEDLHTVLRSGELMKACLAWAKQDIVLWAWSQSPVGKAYETEEYESNIHTTKNRHVDAKF